MNSLQHLIIIGGGPAGYVGAIHAAGLGLRVTLIEAHDIGGTCLNRGCIPTKTLVTTCSLLDRIRRAELLGIRVQGEVNVQWTDIRQRLTDVTKSLTKGIDGLLMDRKVARISGRARLIDPRTVEVESVGIISGDLILLCTGSRPACPTAFPLDGFAVATSDDLLNWESLPSSVVIVGEGIIACEFAFILRSLGVAVTMIGMEARPLPTMDKDISSVVTRELKRKKITFLGCRRVESLRITAGHVDVVGPQDLITTTERVLVCVGRIPHTLGMGLDDVGVRTGSRGEIEVDSFMRTTVPGIYAAGDVTGRIMLAHAASAQACLAVEHMMGLAAQQLDENAIPWAIFTSPEIGCVGLSEESAISRGYNVKCGRFEYKGLGKAQAMDELTGLVKIVADADTGRLLGVHIAGAHASDIIHQAVVAMKAGCTVEDLAKITYAHPTLSEAMTEAVWDVLGKAIHKPMRKLTDGIPH